MDLQKLQAPIERQLALLGFELVCLESAKEGRDSILRLYVDHLTQDRPVTLDDCVQVNEGLVTWMDVAFPSLREDVGLEISSPGLNRPMTKPEHYLRFAGRLCRIQTRMPIQGQKRFKGWIGEASTEAVVLEEDGVLKTVPLEMIQKAHLAPFDEDGAPQPKHVKRTYDDPGHRGDQGRTLNPKGEEEKSPKPRPAASAQAHKTAGVEKSAD